MGYGSLLQCAVEKDCLYTECRLGVLNRCKLFWGQMVVAGSIIDAFE